MSIIGPYIIVDDELELELVLEVEELELLELELDVEEVELLLELEVEDVEEELDELEDAEVAEMGAEEILASKRLEKEELGFEDTELEEEVSELLEDDNEEEI